MTLSGRVESEDGVSDPSWTGTASGEFQFFDVTLKTDGAITKVGFEIDEVQTFLVEVVDSDNSIIAEKEITTNSDYILKI